MNNVSSIELENIVRYILILATSIICSAYIYIKSSKIKLTVLKQILLFLLILFISVFCSYLRIIGFPYYVIISIILTLFSFIIFSQNSFYTTIPTIIISIGIAYCIEVISIAIMVTICSLIHYYDVNVFTEILTSICQIIITYFFMKIRRLQNGFSFFENKKYFGIGILICGPIITLISILKDYMDVTVKTIIGIGTIISVIGLFIWIRSAFSRHYHKKLKLRAEEFSKTELTEKNKEIEKLLNENTSLSSIIHLDNYLINKMETTLRNKNDEAINNLLELSKQRNDFVNNKLINDKILPSTGNVEIDAVITDMYIKTAARGIDFDLNVDCDINYLIHNIIDQTDFEELISSCITNSIVDIENNPDTNGKILITISKPNDIYKFAIMDNGVSKEDNNSISKIIENSKASIKSNTFDSNDSFTKSITIRFDVLSVHKNVSVEKENYY